MALITAESITAHYLKHNLTVDTFDQHLCAFWDIFENLYEDDRANRNGHVHTDKVNLT